MQERLFTIDQVADLLCTSHREVHQWIANGWLTSKPGPDGTARVSERALIGFLKGRGIDIMQLMVSTAVRKEDSGEPARDREDAPDESEPPTDADEPAPADAGRESADRPEEIRPKVIQAADGPAGASLDEDVAAAMTARQILTGSHPPANAEEATPVPSLDLPAPENPRPARPAPEPKKALGLPAGPVQPGQILDEGEVAALLGRSPAAGAQGADQPDAEVDEPADMPEPQARPAEPTAEDLGPFVGEVEQIEAEEQAQAVEGSPVERQQEQEIKQPHQDREEPGTDGQARFAKDAEAKEAWPTMEAPAPAEPQQAEPTTGDELAPTADDVGDQLAAAILDEAVERGASHVHLLVATEGPRLRLRLAGRLIDKPNFGRLSAHRTRALLASLLDLAGLTGADLTRPRTGQFAYATGAAPVRMALSALPTVAGPRLVIAVLPEDAAAPELAAVGLTTGEIERLGRILDAPGGRLLLVCGPDRADRDDVLRALTGEMTARRRDMLVISTGRSGDADDPWDPPRAQLAAAGACSACVDPVSGYRYRDAAGQLAQQDADAVVLAELPDPETAAAALEAAQAGSLVAAGVSAATAAEALGLLAEMGIEGWPLAARLGGLIVCRTLPAQDGPSAPLAALVEPCRQLVRLIRDGADAEAIAEAVGETGSDALLAAARRRVDHGDLRADDLERME